MKEETPQVTSAEHSDNDSVEEYDFTNEPSHFEDEDLMEDDHDEDARSTITLSSDAPVPPEGENAGTLINKKPWQDKEFNEEARKVTELMYAQVTPFAISGHWTLTEDYQRYKDEEMLMYLEDFPLGQWVIPQQQANSAYAQLMERMRWRQYGIPIYGRDRVPAHPSAPVAPPPAPPRNSRPPPPGPGPSQHFPQHQSPYPPMQYQPGVPQPMQPIQHGIPMQVALPHQMGPAPHPNRGQLPPNLMTLPSQPYAQPLPMHHGPMHPGMGYAVGPVQTIPYGMPINTFMGQQMQPPGMYQSGPALPKQPRYVHGILFLSDCANSCHRRPREKRSPTGTPPPRAPTPPYAHRPKPIDPSKPPKKPRNTVKGGRRPSQRRPAEADDFPWIRELNFHEAKANASWDESIYSVETLNGMRAARERNAAAIDGVDAKLGEAQRKPITRPEHLHISLADNVTGQARYKKRGLAPEADASKPSAEAEAKPRERKKRNQNVGDTADANSSGSYSWADGRIAAIAAHMGYESPLDAIDAGMDGQLDATQMAQLAIVWNPSKKGGPDNLLPAVFTVKDSVLTRQQLEKTPILTPRAAECLIDFCPELLWRGTLLRVTSEAGLGNKDVRDRFCHNGSYCDKATITKRISAALGQKQVQPKSKGYQPGEFDWYDQNVKDFTNYIEFFGHRRGHRNMLKIQMQGDKRKAKMQEQSREAGDGSLGEENDSTKRRKLDDDSAPPDSDGVDAGAEETEDAMETDEEERDPDDVSAQDSDELDNMSD